MQNGDKDLTDTIQDHRQVWKRLALEGLTSSFVILVVSPRLVSREPDDGLKEICRRLMEVYMQVAVADDSFHTQREYVYLRRSESVVLKFSTLPNIFCAQGDGRWWHDHRTPGGIMITSNALGHFMYARSKKATLESSECTWALENAMRTISNAQPNPSGGKTRFAHCPATSLVPELQIAGHVVALGAIDPPAIAKFHSQVLSWSRLSKMPPRQTHCPWCAEAYILTPSVFTAPQPPMCCLMAHWAT
jgi:hypothetical protein